MHYLLHKIFNYQFFVSEASGGRDEGRDEERDEWMDGWREGGMNGGDGERDEWGGY